MTVVLRVTDHAGHPAPARVSLTSEDGSAFSHRMPAGFTADDWLRQKERSFEAHYFHTAGDDTVTIPSGRFHLEVMSGFERPLQAEQELQRRAQIVTSTFSSDRNGGLARTQNAGFLAICTCT